MASEGIQRKCLNSPDETRTLENGEIDDSDLADFTASRLLLEPGWSWSENVRPIAGTDSCQVLHTGYNGSNRSGGSVGNGVEREKMPLYMDHHKHVEGLTAEAVAEAHQKDLQIQDKHGAKALKYWFNEERGEVFCLFDAPSAEAAEAVHRESHGLMAEDIVEVKEGS